MKVIMLNSNKTEEYNDSYGARLIEQGKAVLAPKPAAKEPEPETGDAGKPKTKRGGKAE